MRRVYTGATPDIRRRIVQALLERLEVLGPHEVWLVRSDAAVTCGWAAAMTGEVPGGSRRGGRGESDAGCGGWPLTRGRPSKANPISVVTSPTFGPDSTGQEGPSRRQMAAPRR